MKRNRSSVMELIEQQWTCPITSMPMKDPVITADGHSYEKTYILQWFKKQKSSPKTGLQLSCVNVVPNLTLKNIIHRFQTQIKYEFQTMSKQIQELSGKNVDLQTRIKQLTEENMRLARESQQINVIKRQLSQMKIRQKKWEQQMNTLKEQCEMLKLQNEEFIKHISCMQQVSNNKQGEMKEIDDNDQQQQQQKKQFVGDDKKIKKQQQQKSFLPFTDYLMSVPVLYEQDINSLNHSHCPIDMDFFLMHDWSHLHVLNLTNCGIENVSFEKLADHLKELKDLLSLSLCMNDITNITSQTLQKLKHLKLLMFSHQGKLTNPLNDETKKLLESFKERHPQMAIEFEQQKKKNKKDKL